MSNSTLEQWLQRLERLHPSAIDLGLERVSAVAAQMELLAPAQSVVTVAGTNGKGSTVAVLESLLARVGKSTGCFTSPHFQRFNERIRVAGVEVPDAEIISAFVAIEEARGDISLTYFEFTALAALYIFGQRQPDIIILEVGLGGRLDAVNIVDADIAVITSIALDHQEWLGQDRGEIGVEKAGIVRHGRPVVIADADPPQELLDYVAGVGATPVLCLGEAFTLQGIPGAPQVSLQLATGKYGVLALPAGGGLLPENICAALQAAALLGITFSERDVHAALSGMAVTARREARHVAGLDYVLDVAHNPASVDKLVDKIAVTPCKGKTLALFSVMADKDIPAMISAAAGVFDAWFLAEQPGNARAARAADVADMLRGAGQSMISVSKNVRQAFRRAQSLMSAGDRLVVFGSFYTVAEVLPLLEKDQRKSVAGAAP